MSHTTEFLRKLPPGKQLPARIRKYKRDEAIRRMVRRIQRLAPALNDQRYTPGLRAYAMTTLLLERAYAHLKDQSLISPETGEIRGSVDTVRRLAETQARLAQGLSLTPSAAVSLAKPVPILDLEAYRNAADESDRTPE